MRKGQYAVAALITLPFLVWILAEGTGTVLPTYAWALPLLACLLLSACDPGPPPSGPAGGIAVAEAMGGALVREPYLHTVVTCGVLLDLAGSEAQKIDLSAEGIVPTGLAAAGEQILIADLNARVWVLSPEAAADGRPA